MLDRIGRRVKDGLGVRSGYIASVQLQLQEICGGEGVSGCGGRRTVVRDRISSRFVDRKSCRAVCMSDRSSALQRGFVKFDG